MAPSLTNASCTGCNWLPRARLSTVSIERPWTSSMVVWQAGVGLPSTNTVQARHWPSPQPYLAPVKPRSSRRISSNVRLESVETRCGFPLRVNCALVFIMVMQASRLRQEAAVGEPVRESRRPCADWFGVGGAQAEPVPAGAVDMQFRRNARLLEFEIDFGESLRDVLPVVVGARQEDGWRI